MPKIGDPHIIAADIGNAVGPGKAILTKLLPGRITYINEAHRWYLVEAPLGGGGTIRECFKF